MQQTTEAPVPMTFFFGAENPLSNWHPAGFTVNGVDFKNNEQFMMYCKAKLFGDEECAAKILRAETPREHKALGRSVRGFEESKWAQKCEHYVFVGSLAKFRQNEVLGDFLVKTGNTELVEASPYDRIWGVGLSANDPRIHNKSAWLGENRLGKVQMKVREVLLRERGVEASRTAQSIDLLDKLPSEVKVDLGAIPAKVEGGSLDEMQRAVIPADRAQSAAKCSSHMKPDYSHPSHVDGSPPAPGAVFVFGSNLSGRHGAGAAKYAAQYCHAEYGVGIGRTGNGYAIPTKGTQLEVLPLCEIYSHVKQFVAYAKQNPEEQFHLTRVGCGLAGYRDAQVAPLFVGTPKNVSLPAEWVKHIDSTRSLDGKGFSR